MRAFQIIIEGNWAHFKKPETNNNPLTHDFITKTALIGLFGAVLGKQRNEMRDLFPKLSEDLLYGVQVINPVKKEFWGFTMRKAVNLFEKAPKYMEFLKFPKFLVSVALYNSRSEKVFDELVECLKNNKSCFTPVLGLHNCPANLSFDGEHIFSDKQTGEFKTKSFISKSHKINIKETSTFRIGFDKMPTFQDNNFWNWLDKYVDVIYPSEDNELTVEGEFYRLENGENWWLI